MKSGMKAAMAIGIGYVLGRRRKMRMATIMAAAAATGTLGGVGGAALKRGVKMLGSSEALNKLAPGVGELADTVRVDLLDAGKAAASAAVTNRIGSLTDSLHERAEMVRNPADAAGKAGEGARDAGRRGRKLAAGDDEEPELADTDEEFEDDEDEQEPPPRRRSSRGTAPVSRARR